MAKTTRAELRECSYSPAPGGPVRKAWFHKFTEIPFDNERSGYINAPAAIIEMEDGQVKTVEPNMIRFTDVS